MSAPAENNPTSVFDQMSDSEKLTFLCEQITWLTGTVSGLLEMLNQNPMARMMMGRKTR